MPKYIQSDPTAFANLNNFVKPHEAAGRTESAALLIWFLETIYRLDPTEAQDSVCDRKGDAGIDAVDVRDDQNEIVLFQAKRKQKLPATLGDIDLKEFVGSLHQFKSGNSIKKIISSTVNDDLRRLLSNNKVAEKIDKGYLIKPIFICNVTANHDAYTYLGHAEASGFQIDLWDLSRLGPVLDQLSSDWFVDEQIKLQLNTSKLFHEGPKANPTLVYAAVPAKELVKLPGISDTRIFAQNVRLGLGKTRVNKEILETVKKKQEHKNFLTFHNGLTIVAKEVSIWRSKLVLNHYSVCNGCQSLLAFYDNRSELTEALEVLVRIVKVSDDRRLPERIAYRTNNQNAISLRDLSANDAGQVRLKADFDDLYGDDTTYVIKQGETPRSKALVNEHAGRLLLALYVKEPWVSHQKYKIFGDLEGIIFSYDRTAAHVRLSQLLMELIESKLDVVKMERVRKYTLTKFIILYLLGEILREDPDGPILLDMPAPYLSTNNRANAHQDTIIGAVSDKLDFVITEFNYFLDEHGGDNYDYKNEFKSPKAIGTLRNEILKAYEKDRRIGRATKFVLPK